MKVDLLSAEKIEIREKKTVTTTAEFNEWFDKGRIKWRIKKESMRNQRLRCCYCQRFNDTTNNMIWDLEHVLCEDDYPQFFAEPFNLAIACKTCNGAKRDKDVLAVTVSRPPTDLPTGADNYTIPHPHIDEWSHHVKHTMYIVYEALTPKGDELMKVCKLNGRAALSIGLTAGALRTARSQRFFKIFSPYIPVQNTSIDANSLMDSAARFEEEARIDQALKKLDVELGFVTWNRSLP